MHTLSALVESALFAAGEPLSLSRLAELMGRSEEEISAALDLLADTLAGEGRGIELARTETAARLVTKASSAEVVERIVRDATDGELSPASLETLAIVAYCAQVSRATIEEIRGVNSGFILRSLLVRGLVERVPASKRSSSALYAPTFDLFTHLGIRSAEELPSYASFQKLKESIERGESAPQAPDSTAHSPVE